MWHKNTRNLPTVTGEIMDSFVKKQAIAKETSVRGYKFFGKLYSQYAILVNDNKCNFVNLQS